MNANQLVNLITVLITTLCGYFVAEGKIDKSTATQIGAGVIALVTFLVAHIFHGDPPSPTSPSSSAGKFPLMLALALALPALLFTGCASAPQNAYKAESAADITVSAAMTAWGDYVAAYHPSAAEETAVRAAFEKYQAAEILAVDATAFFVTATNGAASSGMTAANDAATQALADLVTLLRSFGVQI